MKNKLLIVWSSSDIEVANRLILLYGSVILPRKYWDEATIVLWGPSVRLVAENKELQEKVKMVMQTGVKFSCCVACTDEYGVGKEIEDLGVELLHAGEPLTYALQNDWKVLSF